MPSAITPRVIDPPCLEIACLEIACLKIACSAFGFAVPPPLLKAGRPIMAR
jgi:hypothetical protein